MKLLSTTALTAALMTAAVPSLTSPAHAWGWRGGGWGWGGAGVGLAAGALIGGAIAASSYGYGYGYPAYGYGYGTGYGYPAYGYGYGTGYAPTYSYGYGTGYGVPGLRLWLWHRLELSGLRGLQVRLSPRCPTPYLCRRLRCSTLSALARISRPATLGHFRADKWQCPLWVKSRRDSCRPARPVWARNRHRTDNSMTSIRAGKSSRRVRPNC